MTLKSFLEEQELNEGIKFFKTSDKLKSIIIRLDKKINKINDKKNKKKAKDFIKLLEKKYKEYKRLEEDYKNSSFFKEKELIKEKYKKKTKEDKKLLKSHFVDYKNLFITIGSLSILKSLFAIFAIKFIINNSDLNLPKEYKI